MEARGQKADTKLNKFLAEKVPSGLQATLDGAFAKAFWLIFQKGMGAIEKTYSKEKIVLPECFSSTAMALTSPSC